MKRYRLKPGESIKYRLENIYISIKGMSRFHWLYGEDGGTDIHGELITLHIPHPLPYIEFLISVNKNLLEEIEE